MTVGTVETSSLTKGSIGVRTLQSVIWPAIAGNVLWAFVSLTYRSVFLKSGASEQIECPDKGTLISLVTLAILGVYLVLQWRETDQLNENQALRCGYVLCDYFLAVPIVAFAIMTESKSTHSIVALGLVYLVGALVHLSGAWTPITDAKPKKMWWPQKGMAGTHLIGLVIIFAGWACDISWAPLASVGLVVFLWLLQRRRNN